MRTYANIFCPEIEVVGYRWAPQRQISAGGSHEKGTGHCKRDKFGYCKHLQD